MYMVYLNTDLDKEKSKGIASAFYNVFDIMKRYSLTKEDIMSAKTMYHDEGIPSGTWRIFKSVNINGVDKEVWIDICLVEPASEFDMWEFLAPKSITLEEAYKQATEGDSYL